MAFVQQTPTMFNPNTRGQETEQQRQMRIQAEQLAAMSASDEEIRAQAKQLEQADALRDVAGPKGRRVGSRNTFVAAHPLEHAAHVWASKVRGKKSKEERKKLEELTGKGRMAAAEETIRKRGLEDEASSRAERKLVVSEENSANLGEYYTNMDANQKERLNNDTTKMLETERHNRAEEEAKLTTINDEANEFTKTTAGERKTLTDKGTAVRMVRNSNAAFKDSYARPFGGLPVVSSVAGELMTQSGISGADIDKVLPGQGGENMEDAVRWLAAWKQGYTLANRNDLFGATLTPSEQIAWNSAGEINLNMEASEIRKRVKQAEDIMAEKMMDNYATGVAAGQNPALWESAMPGVETMYNDRAAAERQAAMEAATGGQGVQQPGAIPPPGGPAGPEEPRKRVIWGQF